MKKFFLPFLMICTAGQMLFAQQVEKPKLVVMMVVDQMRADYLSRYWDYYGNGGFKRLMNEGHVNKNANYNYFPTYTGAGHASISTGSVPAMNGIVGNDWYDKNLKKNVYCAEDATVQTIGSSSKAGLMSPANLMVTTLGDELRLATNFRSKVIGIALKDRAAILTAGHNATGVYWFDETTGGFISSSYYTKALPGWLNAFNGQKLAGKYLATPWNTSLPIADYATIATADDVPYEGKYAGEQAPVFPHNVPEILKKSDLGLIRSLPSGNQLTFDMAKAAIAGEEMGTGKVPDLLNVSFSSPDYIGHQFGPRSIEVADMYIKFDQELAIFLNYLDTKIGKGKYLVCLTADHGASDNPAFLQDNKFPGGYFGGNLRDSLNNHLKGLFNITPVTTFKNMQFYFDQDMIKKNKVDYINLVEEAKSYLLKFNYINAAYSKEQVIASGNGSGMLSMLQNGFYQQRCGDIVVVVGSGYLGGSSRTGTSHGSTYKYDTNVPLIWYGKGVRSDIDYDQVHVSDIAPTLSAILDIQQPSGSIGKVITKVFNNK